MSSLTTDLDTLQLERVVIEVFGGCNYTCQMCPQGQLPGREANFLRKMPLATFENILDQVTPKYGTPVVNLEGSGEPTMAKDLYKYIQACTDRGLRSFIYCNGSNFNGEYMKRCIDAGLSLIRFSVIGYSPELYTKWMSKDNFELIKQNALETKQYVELSKSNCSVESYHLILDPTDTENEIIQYRKNFVDVVGTKAYIWKMHNWSGNFNPEYGRSGKKRSCGRPSAPELTVRAGGINGEIAAVTPCCQVLGPPNESKSVLGHFSSQSFEEIWTGELYQGLRKAHANEDFDSIDYCKNCDFLYDDKEVLAWSNDPTVKVGQPLGTKLSIKS